MIEKLEINAKTKDGDVFKVVCKDGNVISFLNEDNISRPLDEDGWATIYRVLATRAFLKHLQWPKHAIDALEHLHLEGNNQLRFKFDEWGKTNNEVKECLMDLKCDDYDDVELL